MNCKLGFYPDMSKLTGVVRNVVKVAVHGIAYSAAPKHYHSPLINVLGKNCICEECGKLICEDCGMCYGEEDK